eukprot:5433876-Alexandrium_andersonii.AAC.1
MTHGVLQFITRIAPRHLADSALQNFKAIKYTARWREHGNALRRAYPRRAGAVGSRRFLCIGRLR